MVVTSGIITGKLLLPTIRQIHSWNIQKQFVKVKLRSTYVDVVEGPGQVPAFFIGVSDPGRRMLKINIRKTRRENVNSTELL